VTRLWTGQSRVRIVVAARDFSLLQNVQTGCGAHKVSYSLHTGVLSWQYSGWGMKFTTHQCGAEVKNEWSCTSTPLCPNGMDSETCMYFFLLCVGAVIVFLLLLAFFEFCVDCCRKSPVYHFFQQSSIFTLLRALFIPCSDLQYVADPDWYLNFRETCSVHLHGSTSFPPLRWVHQYLLQV